MSYVGNPIDVIKGLYGDKKWDDIISFCQKMLQEDPKDLVALQNMATALLHAGRLEDALLQCQVVLDMNEFDEYALKNKVFALERLRKYDDVIMCADRLLSKNKDDAWAHDSKGLALNELGKHKDALECYDKSLAINQNNITAIMNKALTLSFLQKFEDAITLYDKAQRLDGVIKEAAVAKSAAYQKLGREDEAFLAAQGLLIDDIQKYIAEAKTKKMRVFDLYCLNEYQELDKKEKKHAQKQNAKPLD
ncbi:MAG: tetratricopeptide repeat protein [Candidatus Nitrosotenuis sp.]